MYILISILANVYCALGLKFSARPLMQLNDRCIR